MLHIYPMCGIFYLLSIDTGTSELSCGLRLLRIGYYGLLDPNEIVKSFSNLVAKAKVYEKEHAL